MAVGGRPQGVVALVVRQVGGAALGAQQEGAGQVLSAGPAGALQNAADGKRVPGKKRRGVALLKEAHLVQGQDGAAQVLGGGSLVHAEGGGHLGVGQDLGHALVGKEHGLLNQARRAAALAHGDAGGVAVGVQGHLGLARLEVDGAALGAHALAQLADLVQDAQHLCQLVLLGWVRGQVGGGGAAAQKGVHLVVAQARVGADGRGHGVAAGHAAAGVKAHADGHGQAVLLRAQRADVVAEALRQHGNHAVHQVNRAGARPGVQVHGAAPRQIVRDVGNVDVQLKATVRQAAGANRVIKVARVGGVNGHAGHVAQVAAARLGRQGLPHRGHHVLGLRKRRRREVRGQAMGGNDGLYVHVQLVGGTHAAVERHRGGRVARGVLRDAGHHDVALGHAQPARAGVLGHHEEVVPHAGVQRHDGTQGPGLPKAADEGLRGPLQHGVDDGLSATPAVGQEHLDLVAAHGLAQALASHVEGALGRLHHGHAGAQHAKDAGQDLARLARPLRAAPPGASVMRPLARHALLPNVAS